MDVNGFGIGNQKYILSIGRFDVSEELIRKLPSESEILRMWASDQNVSVSVVCPTFNQVAYIEGAIIGFLKQKTTFRFEIIIHDDASSDGTTDIVEKYSREYPNLIKTIIQSENQHSKGGFKPAAHGAKFASGRYIALCEGDDFWVSEYKLQSQFCALEKFPDVDLCIHDAICIDEDGELSGYLFPVWASQPKLIEYEHVFTSSGQFAPTASMFIRKELFSKLPPFFFKAPIADFFLEALAGGKGIYYIPEKMSVYRRGLAGAWSSTVLRDVEKRIKFNNAMLLALSDLRSYLDSSVAGLVKYKEQQIYFDLVNLYLEKGDRSRSLKTWLYCFSGAPKLRRHFSILMKQLRSL